MPLSPLLYTSSWDLRLSIPLVSVLGAYQVLSCFTIRLNFTFVWAIRVLTFTLSHRGIFMLSGKSILLPLALRVVFIHLMFRVSYKVCLINSTLWALSWPVKANVWNEPLAPLNLMGTWWQSWLRNMYTVHALSSRYPLKKVIFLHAL